MDPRALLLAPVSHFRLPTLRMPISALVITLGGSSPEREHALAELAREPCIELGDAQGLRIPAVSETQTLEAGRRLVERVLSMTGVEHVDVLSVHFEDM